MPKFKFREIHLPTGLVTENECEADSEANFLRHVNQWNIDGMGNYVYMALGINRHLDLPLAHDFSSRKTIKEMVRNPNDICNNNGYWVEVKP